MRHFPAKEFETFVSGVMAEHKIPGAAVSVVSGGEVIYKSGFGYRDQERGLPATPDTIFGVASVTKSFTALAIMQLAESGKLSLDDPIRKYVPGFDIKGGGGENVTIHHFLTHTSGLPPLPSLGWSIRGNTKPDPEDAETPKPEDKKPEQARPMQPLSTYDELLGYLRNGDYQVLGKPGEYCSYSNEGYALLGAVIEKASDVTYQEYVQERILCPLVMRRSTLSLDWLLSRADVTTLYYKDDDESIKHSPNWQVAPPFLACGWLKSTVTDLANYLSMYAGGGMLGGRRLLSPDGVRKMTAPHHSYTRDRRYGYGLSTLAGYHGVTLVEHSGGLKGVASNIGFVPEEGIGVAVLTNLSGAPSGKIWLGAVNLMLGLPVDTPRSVYHKDPWPESELQSRTGTFKSGEGAEIVLSAEEGKLVATIGEQKREILRDGTDFGIVVINGLESEVRFYFGQDGGLWAIGWGGRVIRRAI